MKMTELECDWCHKKYVKASKKIDKNSKHHFCCNECYSEYSKLLQRDEFTPFRSFYFRARQNSMPRKRYGAKKRALI